MSRGRNRSSEALRQDICLSAVRLFARGGFAGTSIQAVADDVGISKQALMHHFPTKQSLREGAFEFLQNGAAELIPRLLTALTAGEERVDLVLEEVMTFFTEHVDWAKFILRDILDGESVGPDFGPVAQAWVALAADYIRRAQAEGTMKAGIDPEATISSLGMLVLSTFATLHLPPGPEIGVDCSQERWQQRRLREVMRIVRASLVEGVAE